MFNDDFGFAFAGNNPFFQLYMQARPASERLPVGAMRDDARRFYYNKLMRYEKQVFLVGRLKEIPHDLNIEFEERKARVRDLYPPQGYFTWTEENPEEEIKSKSMLGKAFHFKQCVLYPEMDGVSSEPDEVIPETIMPETPANPALPALPAMATVYFVDTQEEDMETDSPEQEYGSDDVDPAEEEASQNWDYWGFNFLS